MRLPCALRVAASLGLALLLTFFFVVMPQLRNTAKVVVKEHQQVLARETTRIANEFQPQLLPAATDVGSFSGIWFRKGQYQRESACLATISPTGPDLASARTLDPDILQAATDPESGQMFGITSHTFGRLDPKTGKLQEIGIDPSFKTGFSYLQGLAYDPASKRMLVVCSHVYTTFYAYDPAAQKWEQLGPELRDVPVVGLTYSPAEKVFYTLGFNGMSRQIRALHRFNASGAEVGQLTLASPIPMAGGIDFTPQIHTAGDLLALVLTPLAPDPPTAAKSEEPRLFFVSPKNGTVYLAAEKK